MDPFLSFKFRFSIDFIFFLSFEPDFYTTVSLYIDGRAGLIKFANENIVNIIEILFACKFLVIVSYFQKNSF
jgi:hypothetical protein